tara:strand:+ start:182 stop:376 length:195 start_codon:yes stop_codon:yes gene_type:complete
MTEDKRQAMIARIVDAWGDSIDIKDLIRQQVYEYTEQLECWSDNDIEEEYKQIFGNYEQEGQRH